MSATPVTPPNDDASLRRLRADLVIAKYAAGALSAGFIPLPFVDFAAVGGVQLVMLYRLCQVYGVTFSKEAARSVVASLVAGAAPGGIPPLFLASGAKLLPGIGTAVGQFAAPTLSGAVTYAIGQVFVRHLESGGTLLDFSAQGMKAHFEKALAESRARETQRT